MVRYVKGTLYVCQLARSEGLLIQLLLVHVVRLSAQAVNSSELSLVASPGPSSSTRFLLKSVIP